VEFNLGTDLEAAANDVRDRVSRAMRSLPPDADNPTVTKADANSSPILFVTLQSDKMSLLDLTDYANNVFKERLQTIADVSEVRVWGEQRYAIRLWLDPLKMTARRVTAADVKAAIDRENVELPTGSIEGVTTELTIRAMSGLHTPAEFNNLIIRQTPEGVVRLSDVGEAVAGPENLRTIMKRDGVPMLGVALIPQPGANHIAIAKEFYKRLEVLKKELPPEITVQLGFDVTKTIRSSIHEVIGTIILAFLLVVLVIFVFLRNWQATMIPVLAMPISLLGSFAIMQLCGFSINILTLLAIVLATGLVVDDAIVVLENIFVKIEKGEKPLSAAHRGAREIFFAIIATTLSLIAVMMPIIFLGGMSGRLFREFGAVVAGAVALSAFVSLSLTPMLCTRLLRRHEPGSHSLYSRTEPLFEALIGAYRSALQGFMHRRWLALVIIAATMALGIFLFRLLPAELAPVEDRSRLTVSSTAPEGSSFEYMRNYMDELYDLVKRTVPERDGAITMVPGGGGSRAGVNSGLIRLMLVDPDQRDRSQQQILDQLMRDVKKLSGSRTFVSQEQTIGDRRGGLPVQYVIEANSLDKLREKLPQFLQEAAKDPVFQIVDVNLKFNKPELRLSIDREKARGLGISALDISQALQLSMGGIRYDYFIRNGKQYQVIGQLMRQDRSKPLDISAMSVRSGNGEFVQLDNLITMNESSNPPQLYRFDRNVAATVSAGLAPGHTLGEGIKAMEKIGDRVLDESFGTALAGPARDFAESSSSFNFAFLLALVLVFLVLAAQFESFRDPFIVMLTVPLALAGAVFSLWYFNQSFNIFGQIGIVMLIGLVAKNGILIVEFAHQRRKAGMAFDEAIIDAAVSRFRPIVMTSLTVMLGSLPIALAIGGGAQSRMSMGIAVIGGMLFALVLSLFVVPAIYSYISRRKGKWEVPAHSTRD
jgi:multidrug efflux pump